MAFELFAVRATIVLGMQGMSGLMQVAQQFGVLNAHVTRLQQKMPQIRASLLAGAVVGGVGIGVAAAMLKAANATGDLAMNLKSVQVAGNFTAKEMDRLTQKVFDVSSVTARSAADVADWMRLIRTSLDKAFPAEGTVDIRAAAAVIGEVRKNTELWAKLTGELGPRCR
jgi:hypothetical protein